MEKSTELRHGRHCVSKMHVHLVFVTKYRREVFSKAVLDDLHLIFASVCADFEADLVTKSDLLETRSGLKQDIASLRTEMIQIKSDLEKKIDAVHSDNVLFKWMVGFVMGLSLLILGKPFSIHS